MSEMTPEAIRHLASLARIALSEDEITRLSGELGAIVSAVEAVQKVAGDDVPPTSHPIPLGNVFREDVRRCSKRSGEGCGRPLRPRPRLP